MELVGCCAILSCGCERLPALRSGRTGAATRAHPAVMTWHEIERAQLAQALLDVAPDAPTLCEGWQARHLAAHVVLRERSPMVGAGIAVPALSARAEAAIAKLADQAVDRGRLPGPGRPGRRPARALAPRLLGRGVHATSSSSSCTPRTSGAEPARSRPASSTPGSSRRCGRTCRAPARDGCAASPSASCSSATTASGTTCAHRRRTTARSSSAATSASSSCTSSAVAQRPTSGSRASADDVATIEAVLPSR